VDWTEKGICERVSDTPVEWCLETFQIVWTANELGGQYSGGGSFRGVPVEILPSAYRMTSAGNVLVTYDCAKPEGNPVSFLPEAMTPASVPDAGAAE
jgi:hypothetical protein